ncbi:MAG: cardiolipin synthase [Pseudorhodobacter sp.]
MFTVIVAALVVILQCFAIFFLFQAIRSARTSQGAVAWAIFLFFVPFLGVPAYVFLGSWRYRGYQVARRRNIQVIRALKQENRRIGAPEADLTPLQRSLAGISDLPVTRGNDMVLLPDAKSTFDAIIEAIDGAEQYVLVQFYIIREDDLGQRLRNAMIAAAKRGVSVRLLYDAIGSKDLPRSYRQELHAQGVAAHDINGPFGPRSHFQANFRNHRKTVIVDGHIGFTGGFNVGDEYAGLDPKIGPWRDTHCQLRGPMVTQLQLIFAEDWYGVTQETLADALIWQTAPETADMLGLIVAIGPADEADSGALYFCSVINAARERLWIASPYLIIENDILVSLQLAVQRGVKVRIMVPANGDHWATWLAAFSYFDELRASGVEIWAYREGFMHQKVILADDDFASIGTINMDNRSCRLNFEATAVFFDKTAAAQVERMLMDDFTQCDLLTRQLTEHSPALRFGSPIARLFAPLL